jgi:hypothetical protein
VKLPNEARILSVDGKKAVAVNRTQAVPVSEQLLQDFVFENVEALPIEDIDDAYMGAIPFCTELQTNAGRVDALFITRHGRLIIVECKLWRNPEARRKVVAQILDYASDLAKWTYTDLDREFRKKNGSRTLFSRMSERFPDLQEAEFIDAVNRNLSATRFLLLVIGDGIREDAEALGEFLRNKASQDFSFGLVSIPFYELPNGTTIAIPHVIARTTVIERTVVELSTTGAVQVLDTSPLSSAGEIAATADTEEYATFWTAFLAQLRLDDADQPIPSPAKQGHLRFPLPGFGSNLWITVYRTVSRNELGVFVSAKKGTVGERILARWVEDRVWSDEIPDAVDMARTGSETSIIVSKKRFDCDLRSDTPSRGEALGWATQVLNDFVNVFRPLAEAAARDI